MPRKSTRQNGGKREGAGRKPKEKRLSNYEQCLTLLDSDAVKNIKYMITLRDDKEASTTMRFNAAKELRKMVIPDKTPDRDLDNNNGASDYLKRLVEELETDS